MTRSSRYPEPSEADIQRGCVDLLRLKERQGRLTYVAVPNGAWLAGDGEKRARLMTALKATGLRPGFPDIMIFAPSVTAFAELKSQRGRLAPNQEEWRDRLTAMGFPWRLIRSVEDMGSYLKDLEV